MKSGTVVGRVWSTKRLPQLPNGALMEVALDPIKDGVASDVVVAFDPLGCLEGERVILTQGSVAKGWFRDGDNVVDTLIIGSLDEEVDKQKAPSGGPAGRRKQSAS